MQWRTELTCYKNVASDVVPGKVLTSKSGTLAYLAPEVYAGQGYDVRADWWSLGVLFYECIYNKVRISSPYDNCTVRANSRNRGRSKAILKTR